MGHFSGCLPLVISSSPSVLHPAAPLGTAVPVRLPASQPPSGGPGDFPWWSPQGRRPLLHPTWFPVWYCFSPADLDPSVNHFSNPAAAITLRLSSFLPFICSIQAFCSCLPSQYSFFRPSELSSLKISSPPPGTVCLWIFRPNIRQSLGEKPKVVKNRSGENKIKWVR